MTINVPALSTAGEVDAFELVASGLIVALVVAIPLRLVIAADEAVAPLDVVVAASETPIAVDTPTTLACVGVDNGVSVITNLTIDQHCFITTVT